jgi:hypothetical protein
MERSGILAEFFADGPALLLTALVFLATAVLTFSIMLGLRARAAIKRRAAGIAEYSGDMEDARSLGASSLRAVQRLSTRHSLGEQEGQGRDEGGAA